MHKLSAVITQEGDIFVSLCPELDIASQGKTVEEALGNLKEAVELYLEDEDAKPPKDTPIFTTIEVSHDKTASATGS